MSKEYSRSLRVAEQIQRELARLIQTEVKDPRLGMVSISEVRVSNDLAHAKVYMTVIGSDAEGAAESVGILNRTAPYLRHTLGRRLLLRIIPQLHFIYDETLEAGARLSALIDASVGGGGKKGENES